MKYLLPLILTLSACGLKVPGADAPAPIGVKQVGMCAEDNAFGLPIDLIYTMTKQADGVTITSTCEVLEHGTSTQLAIGQGNDNICQVDYDGASILTTAGTTATAQYSKYGDPLDEHSLEYDNCGVVQ